MMAVAYAGDPTFTPSRPDRLFELPGRIEFGGLNRQWDVTPDGRRFVMLEEEVDAPGDGPGPGTSELVYVGNWFAELVERVPIP